MMPRPTALPVNPDSIPDELKRWPQWVVWLYEVVKGEWTKVPCSPRTGQQASSTDPGTWATYEDALARYQRADRGQMDGIGFCTSAHDPFTFSDHDRVRRGELLDPEIQALIEGTYSELSPSGEGVHAIWKGVLPGKGGKNGAVEVYDRGHYFTVTGQRLESAPAGIAENQGRVDTIYRLIQDRGKVRGRETTGDDGTRVYHVGQRGGRIRELCGKLNSEGLSPAVIMAAVREENAEHFDPPKADDELRAEVEDQLDRYHAQRGQGPAARTTTLMGRPRRPDLNLGTTGTTGTTGVTTGWTADELMRVEFPPPRWAVDDIIPEGLTILAGRPKVGKSWFMLGLGIAVATGGNAWGRVRVAAGDVLYLALEDTGRRLQNRLGLMLCGRQAPTRLRFEVAWPRADQGGVDRIRQWLEEHPEARLVEIDVLARFRPRTKDESGYSQDYAAIEPLQSLASEFGVAIIVSHHQRKLAAADWVDTISGTLGLAGATDGMIGVFRDRDKREATMRVTGRDVEEQRHGLRWTDEHSWELTADLPMNPERREILDVVTAKGPLGPTAIARELGKNVSTIKTTCVRMAEVGTLVTEDGKYMPGANEVNRVNPVNPVVRVVPSSDG